MQVRCNRLIGAALAAALLSQAQGSSAATLSQQGDERSAPIGVIFDTDMWGDIDDMLALAMLHALQDRLEVNLLAVTLTTEDPWSASYVDLVNTFYGHPDIPIGMVRGGVTGKATIENFKQKGGTALFQRIAYVQALVERAKAADGSKVYPHRVRVGSEVPDAVSLLRKTLASQPDASVVVIQVGFSTNLARLLESLPDAASPLSGTALVKRKVRLLSIMAGRFAEAQYLGKAVSKGSPEFNLLLDVRSAQTLFERWPTPIVTSGYEIGISMLFPAKSIEHDFSYARHHPIAESYRYYTLGPLKWPHDHPTFDLTSVLYAVRPERDYFSLSKPGKITVLANGGSTFEEVAGGRHRHLILDEEQKARALEAMVMLASQPPVRRGGK